MWGGWATLWIRRITIFLFSGLSTMFPSDKKQLFCQIYETMLGGSVKTSLLAYLRLVNCLAGWEEL